LTETGSVLLTENELRRSDALRRRRFCACHGGVCAGAV